MVTKKGFQYYSDLLPLAVFESIEEARHFDKRAAMQLSGGKDKFNGQFDPAPSELSQVHDLARVAMSQAADAMHWGIGQEVVEDFLASAPDFISEGDQGAVNAGTISGYLKAQGILQATVHDLQRAYDDLKSLNALHLKPVKR